jgi:hypothetical protein
MWKGSGRTAGLGITMGCSGKDCGLRHPKTLSEVTKTEASDAAGEWLANDELRNKPLTGRLDARRGQERRVRARPCE